MFIKYLHAEYMPRSEWFISYCCRKISFQLFKNISLRSADPYIGLLCIIPYVLLQRIFMVNIKPTKINKIIIKIKF
jgi:hypothetical protein